MARPKCDQCGEKFSSKYNLKLHQQMDACSTNGEQNTSHSASDQEIERERVSSGVNGTVCDYRDDRGFGFVTTADIESDSPESTVDVFFHISATSTDWIEEGDRLQFDVYRTEEGFEADNVEVIVRDRHRDSYDNPEDQKEGPRLGFGHEKDDTRRGYGKAESTESDIEGFQDDRKFR